MTVPRTVADGADGRHIRPDLTVRAKSRVHFDERCRTTAKNGLEAEAVLEDPELERRVVECLNLHPAPSEAGCLRLVRQTRVARCGSLVIWTEPNTHTWLHAECWPAWHKARRDQAMAALKGNGLSDHDLGPGKR
jgi:hypothetical protein